MAAIGSHPDMTSQCETELQKLSLQTFTEYCGAITRLDLTGTNGAKWHLSRFETCPLLRELHLRIVDTAPNRSGIYPFSRPERLQQLQSVTLLNGHLQEGVVTSLATLKALEVLDLSGCSLGINNTLIPLEKCTQLRKLVLKDVCFSPSHKNKLLGKVHHLRTLLTTTEVLPEVTLPDYTDYKLVLTQEPTPTSFSPEEVGKVTRKTLSDFLDDNDEHTYWPNEYAFSQANSPHFWNEQYATYDHNRLHLPYPVGGSPIRCPDGRRRYARGEPTPHGVVISHFWQSVLDLNVSLIVMVKELEQNGNYLPLQKGEKLTFGTKTPLEIVCSDVLHLSHEMTLRILLVNGKKVQHLHKFLSDGSGMDLPTIMDFLDQIEKLEKESLDASTIIHCFQGVGRTGLAFACLILRQLLKDQPKELPLRLDLKMLLSSLRQQREKMVMTESQLTCILQLFRYLRTDTNGHDMTR